VGAIEVGHLGLNHLVVDFGIVTNLHGKFAVWRGGSDFFSNWRRLRVNRRDDKRNKQNCSLRGPNRARQ